jgi:ATP-dependent Clp protease ATP-binding subunit ClpA
MPSFSKTLEEAIHKAIGHANAKQHELATLEHLLLALTEEADAMLILASFREN